MKPEQRSISAFGQPTSDAEALRRELVAAQARIRELEQLASSLAAGLDSVRDDIERVGTSRAWRWGHGISVLGRRLLGRRVMTTGGVERALERIDHVRHPNPALLTGASLAGDAGQSAWQDDPAAVARAEGPRRTEMARELRTRLGPAPARAQWPSVSVIVLSHDGHARLPRLLTGLARHTDYPAFDVTIVDNGSPTPLKPATRVDMLESARIVRNEENRSFSEANNAIAAGVAGEVLLFLNDDVEPFESGWLKELVAALMADGVGAVGSTLIHVAHHPARTKSGWVVQHRGIRFTLEDHLPRAFNCDDGADLFNEDLGHDLRCPAVTAAALAIRKAAFAEVGGFSDGYRFGTEDVDLGLKLIAAGWDVRCSGRSIAFHRESATQAAQSQLAIRDNRVLNRQLFHQRWAARLRHELRRARLTGDPYWTTERAHFGITLTSSDSTSGWGDWYTAHELGDALGALGVRVSYLPQKGGRGCQQPDDLDAAIALLDRFDARRTHPSVTVVAWVRNWVHRWIERDWVSRVNVLLASSQGIADVLEHEAGRPSLRFPLATNPARFTLGTGTRDYDYVMSANRWGVEREIEHVLEPMRDETFAIFGKGWEDVPRLARYHHGEVDYAQLPGVYGSAKLVLDDTAGPTLPYGALNARVFDALASGALVLTNCEAGARELFDEAFPVWSSREGLRLLIDELVADESRRMTLVDRYRGTVLKDHTYERRARQLLEVIAEQHQRRSFVIRIGAPDWERAERGGDLHFARSVERELVRRGHECLIQVVSEWEELEGCAYDVSIMLRGLSRHRPKPGQLNVLWSISHPETLTGVECEGYDLVAVASSAHADAMATATTVPVFVLEQATDQRRFWPELDPTLAHDVVFVGNSRGVRRRALDWLLPTDTDLAVWGGDWDGLIDKRYVLGEHIPNEELRRVYASAKVVLTDHWDDMREHGYISNRVYDALASGAMVVSDFVPGIEEQLGDGVAVYRTPEDLRATIALLLANDEERCTRAAKGRQIVVGSHTFERRVDVLLERVRARSEELGFRIGILKPADHG